MPSMFEINAENRTTSGKSSARGLRKEGKLPAIIYGKKTDPVLISLDHKPLKQRYQKGGFLTQICNITIEGKPIKTLPKAISFHPVTDEIEHIDFYALDDKQKVKIKARFKFINQDKCKGIKRGGVLNIAARNIELLCYPKDIISSIEVDLSNLKIGDSLHAHNITLPENVETYIKSYDQTILTLTGRTTEEETETTSEEETEKGAKDSEEKPTDK